ncbi:hypothetical protein JOQ06_018500 [Pogonophryne albipinna]|uniref:EF-hand domain-containing protein n=1 Tax=Pogonophryne albipinna TaxID=1090488 RepID=A0AAD6A710_9TELE|nr:hypothetical protein JOQ06_018500 [Pogonophryne albipinna]
MNGEEKAEKVEKRTGESRAVRGADRRDRNRVSWLNVEHPERKGDEREGGETRKGDEIGRRQEEMKKEAPKKAKKRTEGGSNVFSMFEQPQIQEFKEAFTIMDQNRDGSIDKNDLRDTFAALGRLNVKQEEIDEMLKEAPGPINFTVFLTMFGEKLKGADAEETILNAFKVFDPEGKGTLKKDE